MKFLTLLALTLSFSAQAASIESTFKKDSILPAELQAKVLASVQTKCISSLFGLKEESTTVRTTEIDQGQNDSIYRTHLTAYYYFDGVHPAGVDITVESAGYAISNPAVERTEVLSVKGHYSGICR